MRNAARKMLTAATVNNRQCARIFFEILVRQLQYSFCGSLFNALRGLDCAQHSDDYRAALLLHDVDGASAVEIVQLLGLPLTTVMMRIHRARRNLQDMLHKACGLSQDDRGVLVCEPKKN